MCRSHPLEAQRGGAPSWAATQMLAASFGAAVQPAGGCGRAVLAKRSCLLRAEDRR